MKIHIESFVWKLGSAPAGGRLTYGCQHFRSTKVLQIAAVVDESDDYILISTNPDARQWNQSGFKIPKQIIQERFAICEVDSTDRNISLDFLINLMMLEIKYLGF